MNRNNFVNFPNLIKNHKLTDPEVQQAPSARNIKKTTPTCSKLMIERKS